VTCPVLGHLDFLCQLTSINQAFPVPVHEDVQLFSAVLVEKRQSYYGDMFSFVQELARYSEGHVTIVLRKLPNLQSRGVKVLRNDKDGAQNVGNGRGK